LAGDEVQILRGPSFMVTDRRIVTPSGELPVASVSNPELTAQTIKVSATPVVGAIGVIVLVLGLLVGGPPFWLLGVGVIAASTLAKVKRRGFSLSVERDGQRQSIYTTGNEADAQLALAAMIEARKRCAS
jgi:hypothetical protein